MTLWEFEAFIDGYGERLKERSSDCIMTGYYAAYYLTAGKRAQPPDVLISRLSGKKQSDEEGLRQIELAKELERRRNNG